MSDYFKIDYNQDGCPIVTMDDKDLSRKETLRLLNSKTQKIEQLEKQLASVSKFPVMMRKMWSGGEVQEWIDKQLNPPAKGE